ncbi:hypothetical protein Agabi119p4_10602 [Agaricus bisporus var. burnettii]|uniref:Uncharacterized protein n=1 Tax=Agaricus bisporus var. burnettii TaxID=192524 RepID=A0A8H7C370_AGABI|nr:hypothetical protein Agabi119p4_10602 [Agaricus bisporus var. burnettii]
MSGRVCVAKRSEPTSERRFVEEWCRYTQFGSSRCNDFYGLVQREDQGYVVFLQVRTSDDHIVYIYKQMEYDFAVLVQDVKAIIRLRSQCFLQLPKSLFATDTVGNFHIYFFIKIAL